MNDIMIIDLYYSRNEQAIKETDINMGNCVLILPIIYCAIIKIRKNV